MGASEEKTIKTGIKNEIKREVRNEIKKEVRNELKKEIIKEVKNKIKADEVIIGSKPVPLKIANKVMKSICKITIKIKEETAHGTGFFMKYSDSLKCLITCYHVINPQLENENIEIEIYNNKKMKLTFDNRYTKYIEKPKDITIIEIKESDNIFEDIDF